MKKALKMLLNYLIYFLVGTVIGTFFYLIYHYLENYVAGSSVKVFSFPDIFPAICYVAACLVFIITPVIIYSTMRQKRSIIQFVFFAVISLVFWNLVLPFSYKGYLKADAKVNDIHKEEALSGNMFRDSQNKVYYFSKDFYPEDAEVVSSVVIDTSEQGSICVKDVGYEAIEDLIEPAEPFRDILMKNKYSARNNIYMSFYEILERGNEAWNKGITFWIGFMTLGFVLCSIYGFVNLTSWKLINACMILFTTLIILIFNTLYFYPVCDFITESKFANLDFFISMEKYIDAPVLCIINFVVGVVFVLIGVIRFIVEKQFEVKSNKN